MGKSSEQAQCYKAVLVSHSWMRWIVVYMHLRPVGREITAGNDPVRDLTP